MKSFKARLIGIVISLAMIAPHLAPGAHRFMQPEAALAQSATGALIAYIGRDGNIWLTSPDGRSKSPITSDAIENPGQQTYIRYSNPVWAPNGQMLALQSSEIRQGTSYGASFWIYNLSDGSLNRLPLDQHVLGFTWSPNSSEIVFAPPVPDGWSGGQITNGPPPSLLKINIASGQITEFVQAENAYPLVWPQWSPNGLFVSFDEVTYFEGRGNFAFYEVSSGNTVQWGEKIGSYAWDPDGEFIVFDQVTYAEVPGSQIWRAKINGSNRTPLTPSVSASSDMLPQYSPTGERVLFTRFLQGQAVSVPLKTLWMVNEDGSNLRQVTTFDVDNASWAPDGIRLAVDSGEYQKEEIIVINVDTGAMQKVADGRAPAWQPALDTPLDDCGLWKWEGPTADKDLRIMTQEISDEPFADCRGAFRLSNQTDIAGFEGYTLELGTRTVNAEALWFPPPDNLLLQNVYLLPPLDIEVHGIPEDMASAASISIRGDMTLRSFSFDLSLFLIRSALALAPPGTSCLVPEEQLVFTAIRMTNIVAVSAELALAQDFVGAREEFFQVADEFYTRSADSLRDVGVDCGADLLELIAKTPAAVIKIGWAYLSWIPVVIYHYFKFGGRPAEVNLSYTPPGEPFSTQIIVFQPVGVTGTEMSGTCWTWSIASPRPGAWRCMTNSHILDPCFSPVSESGYVICGASPLGNARGTKLNLTEPLPQITGDPYFKGALALELEDGTVCQFASTGTMIPVEDKFIMYGCTNNWVIVSELTPGTIWTAERAQLSADNSSITKLEQVRIRVVWK